MKLDVDALMGARKVILRRLVLEASLEIIKGSD